MRIRPVFLTDLDAVERLVADTFHQLFSSDMYLALQMAWPAGQLVAVRDGHLVGVLLSMRKSPSVGRVLVMAVPTQERGRGIGAALLRRFLAECAALGMSTVELEVRQSNVAAHRFYARFGFTAVRPLPGYYPDGEDGVLMVLAMA